MNDNNVVGIVSWVSQDKKIADIDNNKIVTLKAGETIVTGTLESGDIMPVSIKVTDGEEPTQESTQPANEPTTNVPSSNNNGQAKASQPVVVKNGAFRSAQVSGTVTEATSTGDTNYTALWISLTAAAVATAITAGVVYTRKRKSE